MIRLLSLIGLSGTLIGLAIHFMTFRSKPSVPIGPVVSIHNLLRGILRKLIYFLMLLCFVVLVITGFYPLLILDVPLSSYFLVLHLTFAPIFAVLLSIFILISAHYHRFTGSDWRWREKTELGLKSCFWLMILFSIPLILSIILSMYPIMGTQYQEFLRDVHRLSALLFVMITLIHTYLIALPSHR